MSTPFPHLFSALDIRGVRIKNRILSTGHTTGMVSGGLPGDDLVAYHAARAAGGVGLIVVEGATVHETGAYSQRILSAASDQCIPGYRKIADAVHAHGCMLFGQLFHPGREMKELPDGTAAVSYAPSAVPEERHHVMPRVMPISLLHAITAAYADAALRMRLAGLDGVEIMANQGYLPAQFLSPRVNLRTDTYGGNPANRLRFVSEVATSIRATVGDSLVIGLRISGDEMDRQGLTPQESLATCVELDRLGLVDYVSVVAGSAATLGAAIHIVPPMGLEAGYVSPHAGAIRANVTRPVFVAGRVADPHVAERILAAGQAHMCGMTRALISDPELPNKAYHGRVDSIRACIACNQACSGHGALGCPISCIQHPETGRERAYGRRSPAVRPRKILVAGGGPGGMKAAAVAGQRGHSVTLFERSSRLGGQALLAQLLPGRIEFGGIVTNLAHEVEAAGVRVELDTAVDLDLVRQEAPDVVIIATGAVPRRPTFAGSNEAHVVDAWQVLRDQAPIGASVVIADWRCDWVGLGIAEKLARAGCRVRLAVNGHMPGQMIQQYVRDRSIGMLHQLKVEVIPLVRLLGVDSDTVYLEHTISGSAVTCDSVDTLVLALGHQSVTDLEQQLAGESCEMHLLGDCLAPRTAEEAVLEGLKVGTTV